MVLFQIVRSDLEKNITLSALAVQKEREEIMNAQIPVVILQGQTNETKSVASVKSVPKSKVTKVPTSPIPPRIERIK